MNKRAAIWRMTFFPVDTLTVTSAFGSPVAKVTSETGGVVLPVTAAELTELRPNTANFVQMQFKGRITDTSKTSEELLLGVTFQYGVFILDYTDGTRRLLGTNTSPVILVYEKSGVHSAFELFIRSEQPEYSKIITA